MDNTSFSGQSDELSADDLAIIQAFDAMNDLVSAGSLAEAQAGQSSIGSEMGSLGIENPEDMLMLFASEADEEISLMRRALQELEQDNATTSPGLTAIGRSAHKLKGTAGAMGCDSMSAIALKIEEEIQLIRDQKVAFFSGLLALVHAINALESALQSVMHDGQESSQPLQDLLKDLALLHAENNQAQPASEGSAPSSGALPEVVEFSPVVSTAQPDARSLRSLISHSELLIELHTPLQNAQQQVTKSLQELQAAHARLHALEAALSTMVFAGTPTSEQNHLASGERPASSLVARILQETFQRTGRAPQARPYQVPPPLSAPKSPADAALWDEMQLDRFTENKMLLQSFSEAVADVATASAQLNAAFTQFNLLIEKQKGQAEMVRADALRLRSAPFSVLIMRVQRILQSLMQKYKRPIQLEAAGETTEIDQDILEFLAEPLLHLVRSSIVDSLLAAPASSAQEMYLVLLQAQSIGNEIVIEVGFSMPIPGGSIEALRGPLQQVHGTVSVRRNTAGGASYQLRFPRSQGIIQGLFVRAGGQGLVIPLPHIDLIDYKHQEKYSHLYHLAALLGFSSSISGSLGSPAPLILLAGTHRRVAVQVDEIVGDVELIMKPLDEHLQRPGIVGTAVDGIGNVLLVVDLPTLIRAVIAQQRPTAPPATPTPVTADQAALQQGRQPATILVADDSVYMRQSLRQTFERAGYLVREAHDGIEALEYITSDQALDVLMLDIEMPNLNGYDLLNILHSQPGLADCKTILLTSRSSEKHRLRAIELGAYAFLSKPCPQEILLDTVRKALANLPAPI